MIYRSAPCYVEALETFDDKFLIGKAAMTKFEFDGYNNKFDVNNNKI